MKKYKYRCYKFYYPLLFRIEKKRLMRILSEDADAGIEHIGSTAVRGLGGKGIIDILISVPKNKVNQIKKRLIDNNYKYIDDKKRDSRDYFNKDRCFFGKYRIHLQLTNKGSKIEKQAILFRDVLRKSKKLRKEYSKIKRKGVELAEGKGEKYRGYKRGFIKKILKNQ